MGGATPRHGILAALLHAAAAFALAACGTAGGEGTQLRTAGIIHARFDSGAGSEVWADGCAEFAADGRTCARRLRADSVVRVASISKLAVALGVMRLVEAGVLDLDRDISAYLGYKVRNPGFPGTPVTLRALLSHTSSMLDGDGYVLPLGAALEKELENGSHWSGNPPGAHFEYSNFGFVVIGTVMEAAARERFDLMMKRIVLDPLGIEGCFNWAACPPEMAQRAAVLYRTGADETDWHPGGVWVAQVDDLKGRPPDCPVRRASDGAPCDLAAYKPGTNGALFSPQGGLRIAAAGLIRLARVFLNGGVAGGAAYLSPGSLEALLRPQWMLAGDPANGETQRGSICAYGLSVHLIGHSRDLRCRDDLFGDGRRRAGHLGEAYGLLGGLWLDLEARRGALYLVTGTSDDPHRSAARTGFSRLEERLARDLR